jgi:rsbT co-antagonist protein RsbR
MSAITMEEWKRRQAFVGFTDEDRELLLEIRLLASAYADNVMEELYRHFMAFDDSRAFFRDTTTLNRLKALQKKYFVELTAGDYGEEYLANRLRLGGVHKRIALPVHLYMGAYSIYKQVVFPRVLAAFEYDRKKGVRVLQALIKIIDLDRALAIDAYLCPEEP